MPPVIEVNHVSKEFQLGKLQSLKQTAENLLARVRGAPHASQAPFKALDDVNFTVEKGEVVGIIGHNGAGKSTLLKLLAGISKPTRGNVLVRGSVAPLIEVGAGLAPDLTGRENVYLNATILGMRRAEIARKFDEIVAFAELEEFIDTPVKRYSTGMQVRLGFSIATSVEADVLIVDEVLAVGDLAFQRKCFDRMEQLIKARGRTVLLVSHNIRQVNRICSRVILMDHGKLLVDGDPTGTCNVFYERSDEKIYKAQSQFDVINRGKRMSSGEIELTNITVQDDQGKDTQHINYLSDLTVTMIFKVNRSIVKPVFGIGVHTTDFVYLATDHHTRSLSPITLEQGFHTVRCQIRRFPFLPGTYSLRVGVAVGETHHTAFYVDNAYVLRITSRHLSRSDPDVFEGFVNMDATWELPGSACVASDNRASTKSARTPS